jgi:hypothetical protein
MKIGFVSGDWVHPERSLSGSEEWGGSGWVRFAQYMDHLPDFQFVSGTLVWNRDHFAVRTVADVYEYVDVVFMHRLMHVGLAENVKRGRQAGQVIINDIDDWYWGLDQSNHAFRATDPKHNKNENRYEYKQVLHNSDLIIASTPYLASRLKEWRLRGALTVVKNTVDIARFTPKEHQPGVPTVGWAGSTAHRSGDLETLRGILGPMWQRGEIELQHSGHMDMPGYDAFADAVRVPDDCVKKLPMTPHQDYPGILTMDIGIVPLRVTPFNQAKSDIKGLEYAAAGVPFVAQRIDSYTELHESTGVGRIAKNPKEWVKHLTALQDHDLRADEALKNREAIQCRDISLGAEVMREILSSFT